MEGEPDSTIFGEICSVTETLFFLGEVVEALFFGGAFTLVVGLDLAGGNIIETSICEDAFHFGS